MDTTLTMLRNYLKVAVRNFRRHKTYALVNVGGLAVGMATCFVILLFVRYELSYDDFHPHAERIFRVTEHVALDSGETQTRLLQSGPLAPSLVRDIPSVQNAVRLSETWGEVRIESGGDAIYERGFFIADTSFFSIFSAPILRGEPALDRPFTLVLSRSTAEKYFGDENPIGKTMTLEGSWGTHDYEVTAVAQDFPSNAHFHFNVLTSVETERATMPNPQTLESWRSNSFHTYVLIDEQANPDTLQSYLDRAFRAHNENVDFEELAAQGITAQYLLQPITDIHLHSHFERELEPNADVRYIYIFSALALLILGVACINYVNLATARSARRAREVGVRKVVGAYETQLLTQFLCEALVFGGASLLLALAMSGVVIRAFNSLSGQSLAAGDLLSGELALGMLATGIVVALLAGLYPALFLSRFKPVRVLRGVLGLGAGSKRLRRALVVTQFAVSFALIAGTLLISRQLEYMQQKNLGFDQDRVVVVNTRGAIGQRLPAFRTELLQHPEIENVSASSGNLPIEGDMLDLRPSHWERTDGLFEGMSVAPHFVETLDIQIVQGSDLPETFLSGEREFTPVLINETAVREAGWEEPLGQTFSGYGPTPQVVGVVEDFHYRSVKEPIGPLVMIPTWWSRNVLVRLAGGDIARSLDRVQANWEQFAAGTPFDYTFLDDQFDAAYRSEQQLARIFGAFSILGILVACMGLFGLAAFMAESRTKEIGIRKVLGATVSSIVALLSREFAALVVSAVVLGTPVVYLAATFWLQDFAYRTALAPHLFLVAGALAVMVALLTVSYQAVKAALTDPARSLRYE